MYRKNKTLQAIVDEKIESRYRESKWALIGWSFLCLLAFYLSMATLFGVVREVADRPLQQEQRLVWPVPGR